MCQCDREEGRGEKKPSNLHKNLNVTPQRVHHVRGKISTTRRLVNEKTRKREREKERDKKNVFRICRIAASQRWSSIVREFRKKRKNARSNEAEIERAGKRGGERRETVEARTHGRHDVKKIDVFATASIEIECGHSLTNQWKDTRLVEQRLKTVFNKSGRGTILVTHFTHCATKPHVLRLHAHTHSRLFSTRNTARKNELSSRYR